MRAKLLAALGFDAREFAQPVFLSDVVAAQAVPGVVAVDVTRFALISERKPDGGPAELKDLIGQFDAPATPPGRTGPRPRPRLDVLPARVGRRDTLPAQFAYLPDTPKELLTLTEWTS